MAKIFFGWWSTAEHRKRLTAQFGTGEGETDGCWLPAGKFYNIKSHCLSALGNVA